MGRRRQALALESAQQLKRPSIDRLGFGLGFCFCGKHSCWLRQKALTTGFTEEHGEADPPLTSQSELQPLYYPCVVKARARIVFCSTSCALADPVAGLALADRFTDSTGRSPAILFSRGSI
jgi:hypothetical protein